MKTAIDWLVRLIIFVVVSVVVYYLCLLGTWVSSLFSVKTQFYWTFRHWAGVAIAISAGLYSAAIYKE